MEPKQLRLFDTSNLERGKTEKPATWYYITRYRDQEMYAGRDADGVPQWVEHDLQHLIPHVFSNAQSAHKEKRGVGGHRVRSCRYTRVNGLSVWRNTD